MSLKRLIPYIILIAIGGSSLWFTSLAGDAPGAPASLAACPAPTANACPTKMPCYRMEAIPQGTLTWIFIPAGAGVVVEPAVAPKGALWRVDQFGQDKRTLAALNGGFFDPNNRQAASYVYLHGQWPGDPTLNQQLMNNPNLTPYMPKILNRSEFRVYRCKKVIGPQTIGTQTVYDMTLHQASVPKGCTLQASLGAGPRLLPETMPLAEGFVDTETAPRKRDPLGVDAPNARSALGLTATGDVVLVLVAQKENLVTGAGLSLQALADRMREQGVTQAMALDGGSSSSLYLKGQPTIWGKRNKDGTVVRRPVHSVLVVKQP